MTQSSTPLAGKTVVITRAARRADSLAAKLRAYGAEPLIYPTIAHGPPDDPALLKAAIRRMAGGEFDFVVLTSATAVRAVATHAEALGLKPKTLLAAVEPAAVGSATAHVCGELLGRTPSLMPEQFLGTALPAVLGDLAGRRVFLPNAAIAKPELEQQLLAAGALVERVVAYRTIPAPDNGIDMGALLGAGAIDAITFTSGSTAEFFVRKIGPQGLAAVAGSIIACIGPSTADTCRSLGLAAHVVAAVYTESGLADALAAYVGSTQNP
ncbi:MAG: uroporphyrinogen-III synthase [Oscillochloris sp.]|nr:uroporphyrinogen-III synthase [Oscillochloris sp.]